MVKTDRESVIAAPLQMWHGANSGQPRASRVRPAYHSPPQFPPCCDSKRFIAVSCDFLTSLYFSLESPLRASSCSTLPCR